MKILGIISEYNPFHNGHKYQIFKAKELTHADYVIVIMSGSFTQQGNISILNKFDRANIAISEGADLVIELPAIYSISSAENFAFGAVNILDSLGCVDYLSFGAECDNLYLLNSIVDKIEKNKSEIDNYIKSNLSNGNSFVKNRHAALKHFLNDTEINEIEKPNNILAIEYLKALKKLNSKISPIIIKRKGTNHNSNIIENISTNSFCSSTYIRTCLENSLESNSKLNVPDSIKNVLPPTTINYLGKSKLCLNSNMIKLLRYRILTMGIDNLKNIKGIVEGLENRIYNSCIKSLTYEELIKNIKSKRFTESRIKRILINILLDIKCDKYVNINSVLYARILKSANKDILKIIDKSSSIPIISSIKDDKTNELNNLIKESLNLDILASNIREILSSSSLSVDKTNKIL